jgi:ABC-type dipeptide/oligopeptide/nickel transport system permease component
MPLRFLLRRMLWLPLALLAANFAGYAYALFAQFVQRAQNPFGSGQAAPEPVLPVYWDYLQGLLLRFDSGMMPAGTAETVAQGVSRAAGASLGLLALAFSLSVVLGLLLGLGAVLTDPAGVRGWLASLTTLGLALPSFFTGTLLVLALVRFTLSGGADTAIPVAGFGWDLHLLLPTLALMLRPTMQLAQLTATLLSTELSQQYVLYARSVGHSWRSVRWKVVLRNVLAPLTLAAAASCRWLLGELILVEWLFAWPGLGRLLTLILYPPTNAGPGNFTGQRVYFLNPEVMAGTLTMFALLFILIDLSAVLLAQQADPRLRQAELEPAHGR